MRPALDRLFDSGCPDAETNVARMLDEVDQIVVRVVSAQMYRCGWLRNFAKLEVQLDHAYCYYVS